jgi:hypothetical protein
MKMGGSQARAKKPEPQQSDSAAVLAPGDSGHAQPD